VPGADTALNHCGTMYLWHTPPAHLGRSAALRPAQPPAQLFRVHCRSALRLLTPYAEHILRAPAPGCRSCSHALLRPYSVRKAHPARPQGPLL